MDRDNSWDRVEKAYAAMVYGEGNKADNAVDAIKNSYADDVTDEFVVPTVIERTVLRLSLTTAYLLQLPS